LVEKLNVSTVLSLLMGEMMEIYLEDCIWE